MKVLIVEDNSNDVRALELALSAAGCQYDTASLGEVGITMCEVNDYDVMVLDLNLPDVNGYEVIVRLRKKEINIPILILSALSAPSYKVRALHFGADDHVVKPFETTEFMARLNAIVRRANGSCHSVITFGCLSIDVQNRQVYVCGRVVHFTNKEFQILALLARNPKVNTVCKNTLIEHLYSHDHPNFKIIDVFICKLRKKINKSIIAVMSLFGIKWDVEHQYITTVWGLGYRMNYEAHKHDTLKLEQLRKSGQLTGVPLIPGTESRRPEDGLTNENVNKDNEFSKV